MVGGVTASASENGVSASFDIEIVAGSEQPVIPGTLVDLTAWRDGGFLQKADCITVSDPLPRETR